MMTFRSSIHRMAGLMAVALISFLLMSCFGQSGSEAKKVQEDQEEAWVGLHPDEYREAILKARHHSDPILALYREDQSRDDVISFFAAIVHSRDIAQAMLKNADEFDVSPSLAVSLSWEESRFNPQAINRNKASTDRGLFQLNSKSFPKLSESDFFNPDISARYGIAHLRWCLDVAETEVAGLAMYNAGTNRVRSDTTPKATLDYISRILTFRSGLDELFMKELAPRWKIALDGSVAPVIAEASAIPRPAAARFPVLNAFR